MTKKQVKDLVERAAWTFGQSFASVFISGLAVNMTQVEWKALLIASIAAGLSALKTYVKTTS